MAMRVKATKTVDRGSRGKNLHRTRSWISGLLHGSQREMSSSAQRKLNKITRLALNVMLMPFGLEYPTVSRYYPTWVVLPPPTMATLTKT